MNLAALVKGRVKARRCAVQALYQWQIGGQEPTDILKEFIDDRETEEVDMEFFSELVQEIPRHATELQQHLDGILDRPFRELDPVERAVLLIGVYELKFRIDIPWRVAVNEAVELTKMFGAEAAYKYVNGVLDKVARGLRALEMASMA